MSTNIFLPKKMTDEQRELYHRVMDGLTEIAPRLHMMSNLFRVDEVLVWLVKNGVTGERFLGALEHDFEGDLVRMMAYVIMKINHDLVEKPIIVGKDIR